MDKHWGKTAPMLLQTVGLFVVLSVLATWSANHWHHFGVLGFYVLVLFAQAILFERLYIIGHEAVHRKLVPHHAWQNDLIGQLMMLPILFPLVVYRKVHQFHHGYNRKDHHHSALDVFVTRWRITPLVRFYYHMLWYLGVFAGGFLLHSIASLIIFLFIPTQAAQKISPAFKQWNAKDRFRAWLQLLACFAFHIVFWFVFGERAWRFALLYPFLGFAWVWSLLIYIFHYQTSLGKDVRFNVRALAHHWLLSRAMLNFNEHVTHHVNPSIPWYELLNNKTELPQAFKEKNQTVVSFWNGIVQQLRGPTIVQTNDPNPTPQLFVRWED